jgi:hypothetical protein
LLQETFRFALRVLRLLDYAIQWPLFHFVVERNHEWKYALPVVGYYLTS